MDLVNSTHPTRLDLDTLSQLAGDFLYILFVYFCHSSSLSTIFHTVAGNAHPSIYLIAPFSPTCWIGVSLQGSNLHIPDHTQKSRVSFISEVMKHSLETAFIKKAHQALLRSWTQIEETKRDIDFSFLPNSTSFLIMFDEEDVCTMKWLEKKSERLCSSGGDRHEMDTTIKER